MNEQAKDIAVGIGQFYLAKNNNDYNATDKELASLDITNIVVATTGEVVISTGRPGLLIGKRGLNQDNLAAYLKRPVIIVEVDSVIGNMLPPHLEDC